MLKGCILRITDLKTANNKNANKASKSVMLNLSHYLYNRSQEHFIYSISLTWTKEYQFYTTYEFFCGYLNLQYCWDLISNHGPEPKKFTFIVSLNAFIALRFNRASILLRIKGPYSAPRLVLKGSYVFQLI